MEYIVLLSLILLCYAWIGNRERIVRYLRLQCLHVAKRLGRL